VITKQDIHDEARLRILDVVAGHRGGDLTLKTLQVVIRHIVSPQQATRQTLHSVLQLIACANRLEKSLPEDYRHDRHWQRGAAPVFVDMVQTPNAALEARIAQLEALLAQQSVAITVSGTGQSPLAPVTDLVPVAPETRAELPSAPSAVDRDAVELAAVAEIAAAAESARARLPTRDANAMIEYAAERAATLRLLPTADEIEAEKSRVLAYLTSRAAA